LFGQHRSKMTNSPLVSILMPVYNSYDFVRSENQALITKAIDSILGQTYKNFELIILDNQSTDKTQDICKEYANKDSRVKFFIDSKRRYPEGGITQAATYANGTYCMIANDDDLWDKSYIQILVSYLTANPYIDLCYTNVNYIDIWGKVVSQGSSLKDFIYSADSSHISNLCRYLKNRNPIPISFGLYRSAAFSKLLPYEDFDNLKANVDNHFICKLFIKKTRIGFIDSPLFNYRVKIRALDPKTVSDIPGIDRKDLIFFYYLRHQFFFHNKLISTYYDLFKPTQNQLDYIRAISICSFFKHVDGILKWVLTIEESDVKKRTTLEELAINYLNNIKQENFPKIGNFPSDDIADIRFEPTLNHNLLDISFNCLQKLKSFFKYHTDHISIHIIVLIESELKLIESRIKEIETEIKITPEILVKDIRQSIVDRKSNNRPRVSVITASYNLANFVEETLRSVANQNYEEFEHIVIDGGSTDGSVDLIKKYPNIILVSEKDSGYPYAFWKGLRLAKGDYILQCAISDGYATVNWIKDCIEALDKNKDVSLIWGFPGYLTENSKTGAISFPQFHYNEAPQKGEMLSYWMKTFFHYPEGNLCVRKSVMLKCYPSVEDSKKNIIDWLEFSYRFNRLGFLSRHLPVLANFGRTHSDQLGVKLARNGNLKRYINNYRKKVNKYKWRLILGLTKHSFVNEHGERLNIEFDKKNFLQQIVSIHLLQVPHEV